MLAAYLTEAIIQAPLRTLDDLSRDVWKAHSNNLLTDIEAQGLAEAIHQRREAHRSGTSPVSAVGGSGGPSARPARVWSYFPAKRVQRSPDKAQSLKRRRTLAASGPLPPTLASHFTTGELAVLRIVTDEVATKGTCVLTVPEIAARAGVGPTKTRMAIRIAASLGLIVVTERRIPYRPNLSNVVRIVSREWTAWIARTKPKRQAPSHPTTAPHETAIPIITQGEPSQKRRPRNHRVIDKAANSKVRIPM